ncbi:phospholipid-transporting ATPase VA-like, partial [Dendrobates tinctorius]|uniref:phospholipid-transporting ATPase VA-like n=1 Tax=Dendrobates tinctorius TaxID=92724 RepID=UPI003CCA2D9D
MFVALLFWYQFFCGFSGSTMIDQWYLIFFNLLFSSIPQLVTGILDKDLPAEMLIAVPELYRSGQAMQEYKPHMFWRNMVDAFYQSLICFFIPFLTFYDSDIDLFTWGTPIITCALFTIMLHLGIETKTWTWINVSSIAFSILLFFTVALIYNSTCPSCNPPSNPYWTMQKLLANPLFYFVCILSPIAALLPRFLYKSIQGTMFPTQVQVGRQLLKAHPECLSYVNNKTSTTTAAPERQLNTTLSTVSDLHSFRNQKEANVDQERETQLLYLPKQEEDTIPSLPVKEKDQSFFQPYTVDSSVASEAMYMDEIIQWNSKMDQSDIGLMSWITSTPLLQDSGREKQISVQAVSKDSSSVLPSDSCISDDLKVSLRCNTSTFPERIIRSAGNGEVQETTFL